MSVPHLEVFLGSLMLKNYLIKAKPYGINIKITLSNLGFRLAEPEYARLFILDIKECINAKNHLYRNTVTISVR